MSLPISASAFVNNNNNNDSNTSTSKLASLNFKSSTVSRSRSPIVIVYDNEDYNLSLDKTNEENLNNTSLSEQKSSKTSQNNTFNGSETTTSSYLNHLEQNSYTSNQSNYMLQYQHMLRSPMIYESISETNTPIKSNNNTIERAPLRKSINTSQSVNKSLSVTSLDHEAFNSKIKNTRISYV